MRLGLSHVTGVSIMACMTACSSTPPGSLTPDVRNWVIGEAAAALGADGRFARDPVPASDSTISSASAAVFALAYVQRFAGEHATFAQLLEVQHGAPIDFASLVASPTVDFAITSYDSVPHAYGEPTRRHLSAAYLVRLLHAGRPVATVSVSWLSTHLRMEAGQIVIPSPSGGEFQAWGSHVGEGHRWTNPISAERAVEFASSLSGARVSKVPQLILPDRRWAVQFARWKLEMEREVEVTSTGGRIVRTRELYVGLWADEGVRNEAALFVPTESQPLVDYFDPAEPVSVREGVPVSFERVMVTGLAGLRRARAPHVRLRRDAPGRDRSPGSAT